MSEKLPQLLFLAVGERIHRIDDDCLDSAAPASLAEHVVDDRHDVGEALARAGACREDVVLALLRGADCVRLVAVEAQRVTRAIELSRLVDPEDLAAFLVEQPLRNELIDQPARLERRVELQWRIGPQESRIELRLDMSANSVVLDRQEGPRVFAVVTDQLISESEDVHGGDASVN